MKKSKIATSKDESQISANKEKIKRKPYESPRVLSIEPLEAVAAACEPGDAQFGKDIISCVQAQS